RNLPPLQTIRCRHPELPLSFTRLLRARLDETTSLVSRDWRSSNTQRVNAQDRPGPERRLGRILPGTTGQPGDDERSVVNAVSLARCEVIDRVDPRQFLGIENLAVERAAKFRRSRFGAGEGALGGTCEYAPGVERKGREPIRRRYAVHFL